MRYVKLGRKPLLIGVGHHWAVRVESSSSKGCWYEILGNSGNSGKTDQNEIGRSYSKAAKSGEAQLLVKQPNLMKK